MRTSSTVTVQGETYGQELKTLLFAVEFLHSPLPRGVDYAHFCFYIHVGGYILHTCLHIYFYGARGGREDITSGISFKEIVIFLQLVLLPAFPGGAPRGVLKT